MASNSRVSILDYFNIVFEGENGKIESNCKACGTRIQAKRTVTSNFVTHLKVCDLKCTHFLKLIHCSQMLIRKGYGPVFKNVFGFTFPLRGRKFSAIIKIQLQNVY